MIETTYAVTEKEFTEAQKLWCPQVAKKIPGYWPMQFAAIAFGACIGLSLPHLPIRLALALATSFLIYFLITVWRKQAARRYQYQTKIGPLEEMSVRFDDEGYHDHKAHACGGWMSWAAFSGWRETETIFILGRGVMFITVPKRPLTDEQQRILREMFTDRIKQVS